MLGGNGEANGSDRGANQETKQQRAQVLLGHKQHGIGQTTTRKKWS